MKILFTLVLAIIVTLSSISFSDPSQSINIDSVNDHINKTIEDYFSEPGWTSYYKMVDINIDVDTTINQKDFVSKIFVNLKRNMLFESTKDSPFIQGLYAAIDTSANMSKSEFTNSLKSNEYLSETQKTAAADFIQAYESDLVDSISNVQERFYEFKILGHVEIYPVIDAFTFESFGSHDPSSIIPEIPDTNFLSGKNAMKAQLELYKDTVTGSLPQAESLYNRYNAYTYANQYTSNPTSCSYHGSSCDIMQNTAYYNTSYNAYEHNDCANYVSQALKAGGLGTNTTWKPYTYAWIRVSNLKSYLSNNGLLQSVNFSTILSGGIMFTSGSHVMMVVKKDGTESLYSAHSNDRKMYPFSNVSTWSYYNIK